MSTHQETQKPQPLFRPRDFIRMLSLLVAAGFILWAMFKASDPRTWHWIAVFQRRAPVTKVEPAVAAEAPTTDSARLELQTNAQRAGGFLGVFTVPTLSPASLDGAILGVLAGEYVPLPEEDKAPARDANKLAPVPDREWLQGALDREVFLDEDEHAQATDPKRRDADARYHLLSLAKEATREQLAADGKANVRFSALVDKPRDYRGEVIHIKGDLLWVQTFELQRPTPGMEYVYQGLIVVPGTGQSYGILFTDLPEHMPVERLWKRLYLRDVTFDGYFLKVLKVALPADKNNPARTGFIPVLVGRSPVLPTPPPQFDVIGTLTTIGVILAVALVLGTIALWLYRRSERRYLAKMAEVRARALSRGAVQSEADPAGPVFPDFMGIDPGSPPRRAGPPEPSEN